MFTHKPSAPPRAAISSTHRRPVWRRRAGAVVATVLGTTVLGATLLTATAVRAGALSAPPLAAGRVTVTTTVTGTQCALTGADSTGAIDATQAIRDAITACETSTGPAPYTVVIPAGTYKLGLADCTREDLQVAGPNAVNIVGAGRDTTTLVEWVGLKNPAPYSCKGSRWFKTLLSIRKDGSGVEGLKLDTLTYNAGSGLLVDANNTTAKSMWITHDNLPANPPIFSMRYAGAVGADRDHNCTTGPSSFCRSGNVIDDLILFDRMCDDGLSFSFQENATINNMNYQGSRVALYINKNVTVNNLNYSPGTQPCNTKQGLWLTSPSANISINNYVTSGGDAQANTNWNAPASAAGGGLVLASSQNGNTYHSDDIHVSGYRLTGNFADQMVVANVGRNFTLDAGTSQPCDFGSNNALRIAPQVSVSGVQISNCTLSESKVFPAPGVTVAGLVYANDTFARQAVQTYSWNSPIGMTIPVTLAGGTFANCTTAPNPVRYRLRDVVRLTFRIAPGATAPANWTCP